LAAPEQPACAGPQHGDRHADKCDSCETQSQKPQAFEQPAARRIATAKYDSVDEALRFVFFFPVQNREQDLARRARDSVFSGAPDHLEYDQYREGRHQSDSEKSCNRYDRQQREREADTETTDEPVDDEQLADEGQHVDREVYFREQRRAFAGRRNVDGDDIGLMKIEEGAEQGAQYDVQADAEQIRRLQRERDAAKDAAADRLSRISRR